MQQSAFGVLAVSLLIVSFVSLSNHGAPIAAQNVAQTMNGTGGFVQSDGSTGAPANVKGTGDFSSPPPPSSSTPDPATSGGNNNDSSSGNDQKPPETGSSTKCPEGAHCDKSGPESIQAENDCDNLTTKSDPQLVQRCKEQAAKAAAQKTSCVEDEKDPNKKCKPYKIKVINFDSKNCTAYLEDGTEIPCKDKEKVTDACPTYSAAYGEAYAWNEKMCVQEAAAQLAEELKKNPNLTQDGADYIKKVLSGEAQFDQRQALASGLDANQAAALSNYTQAIDGSQASLIFTNDPVTGSGTVGGGTLGSGQPPVVGSQNGGVAAQAPTSSAPPVNPSAPAAQGATYGGGTSPSATGAGVATGGGAQGGSGSNFGGGSNANSASRGGSGFGSAANSGSNYGPLSGNYNSLQQFQPYGGNNGIANQLAQNVMQQQQSYGYNGYSGNTNQPVYNGGYGNAITTPSSPVVARGGITGAIGNFINSLTGAAPNPEGVVYYQNQPIASYRTEDGAIVIDRVRIPRQTPQGDAADPADLVQSLAASDVSVAARIRSAVASGTLTLAVPTNPNDQNQSFANIENLIVQDEVADALRIAEEAALVAKDSIACQDGEAAQDCLARRLAAAQEVERKGVCRDELNRRALSNNAVAHFVGLYDGVANPNGATSYTSSVPSILSQLNQPQQTSIIGTVVDAVGAAIDATVQFIANMFGKSAAGAQ